MGKMTSWESGLASVTPGGYGFRKKTIRGGCHVGGHGMETLPESTGSPTPPIQGPAELRTPTKVAEREKEMSVPHGHVSRTREQVAMETELVEHL